jgi:hypothetical protein
MSVSCNNNSSEQWCKIQLFDDVLYLKHTCAVVVDGAVDLGVVSGTLVGAFICSGLLTGCVRTSA